VGEGVKGRVGDRATGRGVLDPRPGEPVPPQREARGGFFKEQGTGHKAPWIWFPSWEGLGVG